MKKGIFIFTLALVSMLAHAQLGVDVDDYDTEITWGLNKNTNGGLIGGIFFKLAKRHSDQVFATYAVEMMNVLHPKEHRYLSRISGTSYRYPKRNFLYSIRFLYGRERLLYKKAPQQGLQISVLAAGGPTLGIVAPYYILTMGGYEHFDPDQHSFGSIHGSGKLFQGLGDSDLTVGVNGKAGLSFEFGAFRNNVAGLEVGVAGEAFTKEIILVPTQDNRAIFTSFYFTLFWGTRK